MKQNKTTYIIYDDYNSVIKYGDIIGTITPNCGASALRNGIKIIIKKRLSIPTLIQFGNINGYTGGSFSGMVYSDLGLTPSINTVGGGNRMPIIVEVKHD